jgi:hypothetical protein
MRQVNGGDREFAKKLHKERTNGAGAGECV